MSAKVDKCWLDSEHEQCCCNCIHNWQTAKGVPKKHGPVCTCYVPTGWACVHPELELVMPNSEHSLGCECYTPRKAT